MARGDTVLRARWVKMSGYKSRYILEVYVVGKWRGAGSVAATKPRSIRMADVRKVARSVAMNTSGEINVMGLRLTAFSR